MFLKNGRRSALQLVHAKVIILDSFLLILKVQRYFKIKGPILMHLTSRCVWEAGIFLNFFKSRCYIASDVISGGGVTKRKTLILDFCSPDTWIYSGIQLHT